MTDFKGFIFNGPKLEDFDLPRIGEEIGVGEDIIHAVIETETAGGSVDSRGRLKILYEPHIAYKIATPAVRAKLVKAGLAYPKWGEKPYPRDSYARLLKAIEIDETTALMACSWALPQIMGSNYALAGYETVQEMVLDFLKDEDNQLEAMIRFINNSGLDDELRVLEAKIQRGQTVTAADCVPFVRGYNGSGYKKNDYHTKFAKNLARWRKIPDTPWPPQGSSLVKPREAAIPTPTPRPVPIEPQDAADIVDKDIYSGKVSEQLKGIQTSLNDLGYFEIGTLDGRWGGRTRGAILTFRADNGLPETPTIDKDFLAVLATKPMRPISAERANATVDDLRKEEAPEIKQTDQTKIFGYMAAGGGVLTGADKVLNTAEEYSGIAGRAKNLIEPFTNLIIENIWLILIAGGAFVVWKSGILQKIRLKKHQTGEDVSA